ncbi:ABC transporter ATP-binding protein [Bradyrhizobium sp. WYCCWR 13023]|uniref:ABC transporter ATP-binding protein n=1 Tax=Bradyrhizobium zhengyangense TaxID=2911009 RepID=A0A9X1U606_9BRAD|nr:MULTISPECIES: ABC transporter ATP-binding protein [Bradyrhizobium]MCG2626190.1 ABC transporter ATP-binding protein [Bradyrhizobium zhengyangense]MDA9524498.1 ABC transporter ATP-binding protein [Bradyrhizobium sp. CCBAU 11434]
MVEVLRVAGLSKSFGVIKVADDLDFELALGECLGVIGPNGAGKSSVLNLIVGLIKPDGGSINLDGRDITHVPAHRRVRLGIGRAFQIPQPFPHLTAYENVLVAATYGGRLHGSAATDWAMDVLRRTSLAGKADRVAGALPLIDRKRLEFAKALASKPRLILLDEIAAGLTEPEVERLIEIIAGVKADHAMIWIEHIPHALRVVADRILVLNFGRKVLDGVPGEVMESRTVKEIYMGLTADDAA